MTKHSREHTLWMPELTNWKWQSIELPNGLTVDPHETSNPELDPSNSWNLHTLDQSILNAQVIAILRSGFEMEISEPFRAQAFKGLAQWPPKKSNPYVYYRRTGHVHGPLVQSKTPSRLSSGREKRSTVGQSLALLSKRTFEESSTAILSESNEMSLRMALLRECLSDWPEKTSAFVIQQLHRVDLPKTLLRVMISASDDLRFDSADREAVSKSLLRHAKSLRNSTSLEDREAVWTAVQRAGSLISEASAEELMPFLDAPKLIDTRLVAIQSLVRIFESCQKQKCHENIANRAFELAQFLFHPDVFTAGEISAIAIEATILCTVLGDSRVTLLMDAAKRLGRKWVVSAIGQRTQETATSLS